MEGRKLQLTGGSTYVVSLPKKWVTAAGLKAGDTVFLETETDGSVSVLPRPGERPEPRRKAFDVRPQETRDHLLRKLVGAYVTGFALIELRCKPEMGPLIRRVAREFTRMAIGPEIIEESRNSILIQDLSDPAELSPEKCLRRMYMTVRVMLEDSVQAVRTGDDTLAKDVVQRDQEVDRLYWMVAKQYHLAHVAPPGSTDSLARVGLLNHRLVAKIIERIGDHAQRIAEASMVFAPKGLDGKLLKEIEAANIASIGILDKAFTSLVSQDIDLANEAIDARGPLQKMIDGLSHHVAARHGEELIALAMIADSVGRAGSYATDIAEIAINSAVSADPGTP
jgi:phosphate uptake regulator